MSDLKLPLERIKSQRSDAIDHDIEIAITRLLLDVGFHHKRIAALFDCNQGRIAEIATGQNRPGVSYSFNIEGNDNG